MYTFVWRHYFIFSSADCEVIDPDRRKNTHQPTKHEQQEARKAEIIARTQQGETAEQIAAAFAAQGELYRAKAKKLFGCLQVSIRHRVFEEHIDSTTNLLVCSRIFTVLLGTYADWL